MAVRSSGHPRVSRTARSAAHATRSRSTAATWAEGRARSGPLETSDQCGSWPAVEARGLRDARDDTTDIQTPWARAQGVCMSVVSSRASRRPRASTAGQLPHWSEVSSGPLRARPSAHVAAVLRDLVAWAADLAVLLTRGCPEDRTAIERVRHY